MFTTATRFKDTLILGVAALAFGFAATSMTPVRAESPLGDRAVAEQRAGHAWRGAPDRQVVTADTVIGDDSAGGATTAEGASLPYDNRAVENRYYNVFTTFPFRGQ